MRTEADVRREVERRLRLRGPLDEPVWETALAGEKPAAVLEAEPGEDREEALGALVSEVQRLRRLAAVAPRRPSRRAGAVPTGRRLGARVRLQALEAAELEPVLAFRREALRGRLVRAHRLDAWLYRQRKRQGPPTWIARETLGDPGTGAPDRLHLVRWREVLRLVVVAEDESGARHQGVAPVQAEGRLGRLKALSRHLAGLYGWEEAEAAGFVLTGAAPAAFAGTWHLEEGASPDADRIALRVHPEALPAGVRDAFSAARRSYLAGRVAPQALSERHVALAIFAAKRPGEPWLGLHEAWNREHPAWAYSDVRNLRRDARMAYERLRGSPLPTRPRRARAPTR